MMTIRSHDQYNIRFTLAKTDIAVLSRRRIVMMNPEDAEEHKIRAGKSGFGINIQW